LLTFFIFVIGHFARLKGFCGESRFEFTKLFSTFSITLLPNLSLYSLSQRRARRRAAAEKGWAAQRFTRFATSAFCSPSPI
jgi:hypothetical protein